MEGRALSRPHLAADTEVGPPGLMQPNFWYITAVAHHSCARLARNTAQRVRVRQCDLRFGEKHTSVIERNSCSQKQLYLNRIGYKNMAQGVLHVWGEKGGDIWTLRN
jgi:hypothetical protein